MRSCRLRRVPSILTRCCSLEPRPTSLQRRILIQLNRGEQRYNLARVVHYGQRGELRARYHEGMEDHLGALGLVVNAITVWNTGYLQTVLDWLEVIGEAPNPEDLAHLSPLRYE